MDAPSGKPSSRRAALSGLAERTANSNSAAHDYAENCKKFREQAEAEEAEDKGFLGEVGNFLSGLGRSSKSSPAATPKPVATPNEAKPTMSVVSSNDVDIIVNQNIAELKRAFAEWKKDPIKNDKALLEIQIKLQNTQAQLLAKHPAQVIKLANAIDEISTQRDELLTQMGILCPKKTYSILPSSDDEPIAKRSPAPKYSNYMIASTQRDLGSLRINRISQYYRAGRISGLAALGVAGLAGYKKSWEVLAVSGVLGCVSGYCAYQNNHLIATPLPSEADAIRYLESQNK